MTSAPIGSWPRAAGAHDRHTPEVFEPKHEFAMDWYYPVLSGALAGEAAAARIDEWWDTFVHGGPRRALRLDRPVGHRRRDRRVRAGARCRRASRRGVGAAHLDAGPPRDDGSYWTGIVYPERETFPFAERTTYTAGAIVLAADALSDATPAARALPGRVAAGLARPHRASVEAPPA